MSRATRIGLGVAAATVLTVVAVVALAAFQPWKLFVDQVVDEAAPVVSIPAVVTPPATPGAVATSPATPGTTTGSSPSPGSPTVLAAGTLLSHEHQTTGSVRLLSLPDGRRVLRIENLDTSNGPDLKVWLSDAPVIDSSDGWHVFDDGRWLDLGPLKGNVGNQNYDVPAGADLTGLTSVTIWCDRFDVSFGAARLA
ncbi:MAG: hypothetical protein EPO13_12005 [Actinomycetota bacterium]|nr:MAG: hypothetical protein EPO13_12005 [Actinomycetota bacterium]